MSQNTTAKNIIPKNHAKIFYDIESIENLFTLAAFHEQKNQIMFWYRDDSGIFEIMKKQNFIPLINEIYRNNENFNGQIFIMDLNDGWANKSLFQTFGAMMPEDNPYPKEFFLQKDTLCTEQNLSYFMGYNSYNYDSSVFAYYVHETLSDWLTNKTNPKFRPPTAKEIKTFSDELFDPQFKKNMPSRLLVSWDPGRRQYTRKDWNSPLNLIRKALLLTGRHIDVARLNEKQTHVGLKRIMGMIGLQILESEQLSAGGIKTVADACDLSAYNVSDVVNLSPVNRHRAYSAPFQIKSGLLNEYPELVFMRKPNTYEPDVQPGKKERNDRLCIDSSSAQFATKCLCPYDSLQDIETVSFLYPAKEVAEQAGIAQTNVLEDSRNFFYRLFPDKPEFRGARQNFDRIYQYYKNIEGRNFNESENYYEQYRQPDGTLRHSADNLRTLTNGIDTNLFYYKNDGSISTCFVNFSTGGIHGQEINLNRYYKDLGEYQKMESYLAYTKQQYPKPTDALKAKTIIMPDGTEFKTRKFVKAKSTMKSADYKDAMGKEPKLFDRKEDKGFVKYELNKDYAYTSADIVNHEDFKSYYPNLLIQMRALFNKGLGYDRYHEIFEKKEYYGNEMKRKDLPSDVKAALNTARNGVKLVLNSASGAADANFKSAIRMNNQIISMRIIGQLFSWRIGQAQTYAGARIPSTNTDGLYSVMEEKQNNQLLEQLADGIRVEIEPERMLLISKDTNNRLEVDPKTYKIIGAGGGDLSCWKEPNPEKSLSHPAIIDWALAQYLIYAYQNSKLDQPLDETYARQLITNYPEKNWMLMYQNIVASNPGSDRYIYSSKDGNIKNLQHYNRVYYMREESDETVHLQIASGRKIPDKDWKKRLEKTTDGTSPYRDDPEATEILSQNGVKLTDIHKAQKEATVVQISRLNPEWHCLIENHNLFYMKPERQQYIRENLDYDAYLGLLKNTYEKNWQNHN